MRRHYIEGGTYFFTVVTAGRMGTLCLPESRNALRDSVNHVRKRYPFDILAWVLLPDHLHCIWNLPVNDNDFSIRWRLIKKNYSFLMKDRLAITKSESKMKKRESGFWQRRFWEHGIRDEADLLRHFDYVHFNPVKHGLVKLVCDWEWSTYHRYLKLGYYENEEPMSNYEDHSDVGNE